MATGRKTVVVGQVIDPATWGNPLWDQSVQTFTSAPDRTAQFPAPKQGAVTWLEDVKRLEVWDGGAWVPLRSDLAPVAVARLTANTGINPGAYWPIGASGSPMTTEVRGLTYDPVTGRFTITAAGLYRVTWTTSWAAMASPGTVRAASVDDGVSVQRATAYAAAQTINPQTVGGARVLRLAAGAVLRLSAFHDAPVLGTLVAQDTAISIEWVGA